MHPSLSKKTRTHTHIHIQLQACQYLFSCAHPGSMIQQPCFLKIILAPGNSQNKTQKFPIDFLQGRKKYASRRYFFKTQIGARCEPEMRQSNKRQTNTGASRMPDSTERTTERHNHTLLFYLSLFMIIELLVPLFS